VLRSTVVAVAVFLCAGLQAERSNDWPRARDSYLAIHPACEACGATQRVEVHHVAPVHVRPDMELDPRNLITLDRECHFRLGHWHNWRSDGNPYVREDAKYWRAKVKP
jgi:5-methylcytosine-specific restriction enzyme A